jgi:hypothetical protein
MFHSELPSCGDAAVQGLTDEVYLGQEPVLFLCLIAVLKADMNISKNKNR